MGRNFRVGLLTSFIFHAALAISVHSHYLLEGEQNWECYTWRYVMTF